MNIHETPVRVCWACAINSKLIWIELKQNPVCLDIPVNVSDLNLGDIWSLLFLFFVTITLSVIGKIYV